MNIHRLSRSARFAFGALLFCALSLPGAGLASPSDGDGDRRGHHAKRFKHMVKALDLDDETAAQVKAIHKDRAVFKALKKRIRTERDQLDELFANNAEDAEILVQARVIGELKVEMKLERVKRSLAVRALLTPEQRERMHAFKSERRKHRRGGKHHKRGRRHRGE